MFRLTVFSFGALMPRGCEVDYFGNVSMCLIYAKLLLVLIIKKHTTANQHLFSCWFAFAYYKNYALYVLDISSTVAVATVVFLLDVFTCSIRRFL